MMTSLTVIIIGCALAAICALFAIASALEDVAQAIRLLDLNGSGRDEKHYGATIQSTSVMSSSQCGEPIPSIAESLSKIAATVGKND